jgi:hypothetical protein
VDGTGQLEVYKHAQRTEEDLLVCIEGGEGRGEGRRVESTKKGRREVAGHEGGQEGRQARERGR